MSISRFFSFVLVINNVFSTSVNRPHFSSCALWDTNAITIANESSVGQHPAGIFINTHNNIYVSDRQNNRILLWYNETWTPIIVGNLINSWSIFIIDNNEIFIDNGYSNERVDRWSLNGTYYGPAMYANSSCTGLFIDIINNLYCSSTNQHRVFKQIGVNTSTATSLAVAGTGCPGPIANMLDHPNGIFVDEKFNLYVADTDNNRIQCFESGRTNAKTIAGFGASIIFLLNRPTSIILDVEGYMFIVDSQNHRIIRSVTLGFECLVGCSGNIGPSASQLNSPQTIAFDEYGNIFVTDYNNHRVQKFNLIKNECATTTKAAAIVLPSQCSSYTTITDGTRQISSGASSIVCDSSFTESGTWVRFLGAAGTMLANSSLGMNRCNTHAPGYYNGRYPATGLTTTGPVCYHWNSGACQWSNSISVSNCNGYYVYRLVKPPNCSLRYCTH